MDWGTARAVTPKGCGLRSSAPFYSYRPPLLRYTRLRGLTVAHEGAVGPERTAHDRALPDSHPLPVHAIQALGGDRRLGVSSGHCLVIFLLVRRLVCARDGLPVLASLLTNLFVHDSILP